MAFVPKTWVNRAVEFAGRRKLTAVSGQANTFDVTRAEGTIFTVGDEPDAAGLSDLENRVKNEFDAINTNLSVLQQTKIKLLWTNANPTSAFGATKVSLNLTEYDFVEVICLYNTAIQYEVFPIKVHKGLVGYVRFDDSSSSVKIAREVTIVDNTGVTFDASTPANHAIPYKIFGYKIPS